MYLNNMKDVHYILSDKSKIRNAYTTYGIISVLFKTIVFRKKDKTMH